MPEAAAGPHVLLACVAMATRFELVLPGADTARLRAAGEEALALVRRLDRQLSCHRPNSDVGRVNARAAERAVSVERGLFDLLLRARRLHQETLGAFDITVGPLLRCWREAAVAGGEPGPAALARARQHVGMELVELDEARSTVRFARPGVSIDLGAIGKGFALDQAAALLRELGVERALLHGGTSSVCALGAPPGEAAWQIALERPGSPDAPATERLLALVPLADRALGVSAVWGRYLRPGDETAGHVLDPRAARPVAGALLAAVATASATDADALSTALLVLGPDEHRPLTDGRPEADALVLDRAPGGGRFRIWSRGLELRSPTAGGALSGASRLSHAAATEQAWLETTTAT